MQTECQILHNKNPSSSIKVGKTSQLSLRGNTKNKKITWDSSNNSVATINSKGLVSAKSKGTVKITAKVNNKAVAIVSIKVESIPKTNSKYKTFGETFVFDDLEITFGSNIKWTIVDNMFDENNGKDVIEIPITIKNISNDTHGLSMFDYEIFGTKGVELSEVGYYFDSDIVNTEKIRPGATLNTFVHLLYDGNGYYYVEFAEMFSKNKIEVELYISK